MSNDTIERVHVTTHTGVVYRTTHVGHHVYDTTSTTRLSVGFQFFLKEKKAF